MRRIRRRQALRKLVGLGLCALVYGNPCAVHNAPIEVNPFYHFLPGSRAYSITTAGCNLHCLYCQNWTISQRTPEQTQNFDLPPKEVVEEALLENTQSLPFTYSEPTVFYEYITIILYSTEGDMQWRWET